jgi:hypothetical protein
LVIGRIDRHEGPPPYRACNLNIERNKAHLQALGVTGNPCFFASCALLEPVDLFSNRHPVSILMEALTGAGSARKRLAFVVKKTGSASHKITKATC